MTTKRIFTFVVLICIILNLRVITFFADDIHSKYEENCVYITLDIDKENITKNEIDKIILALNEEFYRTLYNNYDYDLDIEEIIKGSSNCIESKVVLQNSNKIVIKMLCDKSYIRNMDVNFVFYFIDDNGNKIEVNAEQLKDYLYLIYEADKDNLSELEVTKVKNMLDSYLIENFDVVKEDSNKIGVKVFDYEAFDSDFMKHFGGTLNLSFKDESGNIIFTGKNLLKASASFVDNSFSLEFYVELTFDEEGKEILADATRKNIGKRISILLDDDVISNPIIIVPIEDGKVLLYGFSNANEAGEFARILEKGYLSFNLNLILEAYCSYI